MSAPLRARLTGPAFRFAMLLREFGHLDDAGLNELLITSAEAVEPSDDPTDEPEVDVAVVRRLAAGLLFARGGADLTSDEGILAEDWPLLFS